jgi:NhaA family Na+:H+ antiporter
MTEACASGPIVERLARPFQRFFAVEAASSALLLAATLLALALANSPWAEAYAALWHTRLELHLGAASLALSLEHWVNDGLMTIFFFVVGLEIKHELVAGELASRARAALPMIGALGGMVVPAALYAVLHAGGPAAAGWGVPMATDIAFAVAALAALGSRVPQGLRVFLLALAIVDDLGAVTVIAVFYSESLSAAALAAAGAGLAAIYAANRAGVRAYPIYWALGAGVWLATLHSGVHATVAGVALGLLTPASTGAALPRLAARGRELLATALERGGEAGERKRLAREMRALSHGFVSPLEYLTGRLHPWVAFVIMPVFALANAGVALEAETLADPLGRRVALAVALGLAVGKPLGIAGFSLLGVRLGFAELPQGVTPAALAGVGMLGGIGFTMALFLTALAFADPGLAAASKVGVLAASAVAAAAGVACLAAVLPRAAPRAAR